MASPPPWPKRSVRWRQWGHTKPLMFSTTPRTGVASFRQKVMHLRTSAMATSWGVVTMTAPSASAMSWQMLSGSSPVPGGESTTR